MPRIALIPIVVLITGVNLATSIASCVLVVFFLGFFNAFEGGRSVSAQVLQNAELLGASGAQLMLQIRMPYVLLWTFAVIPNAISFGLIAVVTTELLTGSKGMGGLILSATTQLEADLTFAVVALLSVVGMTLYSIANQVKRRVLHWA